LIGVGLVEATSTESGSQVGKRNRIELESVLHYLQREGAESPGMAISADVLDGKVATIQYVDCQERGESPRWESKRYFELPDRNGL